MSRLLASIVIAMFQVGPGSAQDRSRACASAAGPSAATPCAPSAERLRREGLDLREAVPRTIGGTEIRIGGRVRGEYSGISGRR